MQFLNNSSRVQIGKILLVTEFPPESHPGAMYALELAREHRAGLYVAHLLPRDFFQWLTEFPLDVIPRSVERDLFELAKHEVLTDPNTIQRHLQRMTERHDFDLIVISMRGKGNEAGNGMPGKAGEHLFGTRSPVLVIGPGVSGAKPLGFEPASILYATDFSGHAFAAGHNTLFPGPRNINPRSRCCTLSRTSCLGRSTNAGV